MGSCMSTPLPSNVFKVTPINDDRRNVQKGILIVTKSDIRYIDSHTDEQLEWPLKYIRNWAYNNHMFSFEAGKKCQGGEGLYAFTTDRAQQLYELVVNLPRDEIVPGHHRRLPSSSTTQQPPSPVLPARPNTVVAPAIPTSPPPLQLPNPHIVPITPYKVLEFDKEPQLYPTPPAARVETEYTTISFSETEQLSIRRRNGNVPITTLDTKRHTTPSLSHTSEPHKSSRSSLDSRGSPAEGRPDSLATPNSASLLPGAQKEVSTASLTNKVPSSARRSSKTASQEVLTPFTPEDGHGSYANVTPGSVSLKGSEISPTSLTNKVPSSARRSSKTASQEVLTPFTPEDGHGSYANVTPGSVSLKGSEISPTSLTNKVPSSARRSSKTASQEVLIPIMASTPEDAHSSYANIMPGSASHKGNEPSSSTPLTHKASSCGSTKTVDHELSTTQLLTSTPQDRHDCYENLLLGPTTPKGSEPTPFSTPQSYKVPVSVHGSGNYPELDLSASITSLRGSGTSQMMPIPEASKTDANTKAMVEAAAAGEAEDKPSDKEKVNYVVVDFGAMKELEKMQKERELLKQGGGQPMSREERTNSTQNHKKHK